MNEKTIHAIAAKCLRLEAKIFALSQCVQALAERQGIAPDKFADVLNEKIEESHQRILEKVEDIDPAEAAILDQRHLLKNLFD